MEVYYFRLFFGGKVLKSYGFSLNTETNLVSITETDFYLLLRLWKKKTKTKMKFSKIFKDWKFYYVPCHCCNTFFFFYFLAYFRKICSPSWSIYEKCSLKKYFLVHTNLYLDRGDKSTRCDATLYWKTWILL